MPDILARFDLDVTGTSVDNYISGEPHTLNTTPIRVVIPNYGAFFTESIEVRNATTNALLTKGVQYYPANLYEVPTAKYGKEICGVIIITDTTVTGNIKITYQALGGDYNSSTNAIIQLLEAASLDNRPVTWGNIVLKPSQFPPSSHLHDVGDVYGFEFLVDALDRLRSAVNLGDDVSHDIIYQYIDNKVAPMLALLTSLQSSLSGKVSTTSKANTSTARGQIDNTTWMTPATVLTEVIEILSPTTRLINTDFVALYSSIKNA